MQSWIVWTDKGKWGCARTATFEYAEFTANEIVSKFVVKRDMTKAIIKPCGLGLVMDAPMYRELDPTKKIVDGAWAVEAPTRYQAIKIAQQSYALPCGATGG